MEESKQDPLLWTVIGIIVAGGLILAFALSVSGHDGTTPTASSTAATSTSATSSAAHTTSAASGASHSSAPTSAPAATPITATQPSGAPYQTVLLQLGTTHTESGVSATPLAVLQDTRCPADVECIQAGTVEVSMKLSFDGYSTTRTFVLNVPQSAYGYTVELTNVRPDKQEGNAVNPNDYRFVFTITKN